MMRQIFFLLLITAAAIHPSFGQSKIAIVNVTVIDGTDHPPRTNANVIIQGSEIEAITAASRKVPPDAKLVDGTGKFLIPGLWNNDLHGPAYSEAKAPLLSLVSYGVVEAHLGTLLGLRMLDKTRTFQFFSYLFNLEEWAAQSWLRDDTGVDRQIVSNPVAWHSDHLRVGKRYVQMYSLKTTPEASRPCLFSGLLTLDCDSVLCSTWRPKSTAAARHEIDAQERFISFFKVGVLTRVMSGRDTASLETGAGAKAANSSVDDLSVVIRELDKKAQGEYSLRLLLAANSAEQLRDNAPAVHRIFVDARAQVIEETLGKPFELRERPDDKLPYDPKAIRSGSQELQQVPEASAPSPQPNEPATSEAIEPELSTVPDAHEEQNVITHG